jgi:ADP-L-glycero-D-manno-heptose 6-epimerase
VSVSGPTYVVTGGAGFVGANLAAALLARDPGAFIIVVDNFRSGSFANIVEACERRGVGAFRGDVIPAPISEIFWQWQIEHVRPAAIFHLGAITDTTVADEALMLRENVGGFEELLEHAAALSIPVVYASSAATYGSPPQARERTPFPTDAAGQPSNVYGFSKWLMESVHRRFAGARQPDSAEPRIVGLRYFNVFGPGESRKGKMASMVYQLARQMLGGQRPRIFEDGAQARDQVYVDDVVECTIAAAAPGARPGVYNLGSGVATSFNDIVAAVRDGLGISARELPTDYFPMPEAIRAFYQDYTCADMSQTEQALNWKPRWEPHAAMREYARHLRGR